MRRSAASYRASRSAICRGDIVRAETASVTLPSKLRCRVSSVTARPARRPCSRHCAALTDRPSKCATSDHSIGSEPLRARNSFSSSAFVQDDPLLTADPHDALRIVETIPSRVPALQRQRHSKLSDTALFHRARKRSVRASLRRLHRLFASGDRSCWPRLRLRSAAQEFRDIFHLIIRRQARPCGDGDQRIRCGL